MKKDAKKMRKKIQVIDIFRNFAVFLQKYFLYTWLSGIYKKFVKMRQLKIQKSITNRSSEALDKYLVEIGRAPLISIDEEIELAQKIRKGGPEGERAKD